ncbi:MAG TPA: hypothetical protein VFG11_10670 [Acidobacteriota bacterium]|nr:hypothetical protein [Acidobacteriota bacterium]
MAYRLKITEKEGYSHIQITGENSLETVRNYLAEINRECRQRGFTHILVEEFLHGESLSIFDVFQIASQGSAEAAGFFRKIAYVDRNVEHSTMKMEFAETVASNRGLNVRMFSNTMDAEDWLKSANHEE